MFCHKNTPGFIKTMYSSLGLFTIHSAQADIPIAVSLDFLRARVLCWSHHPSITVVQDAWCCPVLLLPGFKIFFSGKDTTFYSILSDKEK
jgi:hypothetical protein